VSQSSSDRTEEHAVAQDAGVVDQHVHFAEGGHGGIDDGLRAGHAW
jgi:hypothetical protein